MKVMCIDSTWNLIAPTFHQPLPEVGSIYTAVDECKLRGNLFFILGEYPSKFAFTASNFAPLQEEEQEELIEELETVAV